MGSVLLTVVEAFSWCWGGCNDDNQLIVTGLVIVTSLSFLISLWTVNFSAKRKRQFKMPPGPRGLPFAGSLPFMDPKIPKYFATLASRYGPVFKVKLGSKFSVVVSSPATAKEVLSEKDSIFANRNPPASTFSISYGGHDMVFSDNNAEWRMLRMVWARTISSKSRLDALYDLRRLEVLHTVRNIHSKINTPINIYQQMSLATINMLTSMMWGGMVEGGVRTGEEFRQMVNKVVELLVNPNVSDLFPVLARFDIQGVERKMKRLFLWFDCFFDAIIEQRIKFNQTKGEGTRNKNEDILELLLQLKDQGDPKIPFTVTHLKALFQLLGSEYFLPTVLRTKRESQIRLRY
ncbi:hypothetical protein GIB67_031024 [Kingdonia uniflora]|uniref:Cytochrome P450 n=1 Tax=Kingdonia uniflora TaxID=39325 RepID=A0A7J7NGW0_9MAGN|nr:hypothetical protein GIB67_031024 [Kingdonia uniflora]